MTSKYTAQMIGNRLIVWNIKEGIELYSAGFYGKPIGVRKPNLGDEFRDPSEISYFEGLYLLENKKLTILDEKEEKVTKKVFMERCNKQYMNFENKMYVYRYLRNLGYIVRPGLKFGVDFAVYIKGPGLEHSPYMVQIIEQEGKINPIELVRAGRLATTVRKNFVVASKIKKKLHFFVFNRYKP
ncbi:MAG: tRNA-intron lyase [Asgard group archaeon]|nr:tRNA-intron lyase [Asgard group archaeon]